MNGEKIKTDSEEDANDTIRKIDKELEEIEKTLDT